MTTRSRAPIFQRTGRDDPGSFTSPLPPVLAGLVAQTEEATEHERAVGAWRESSGEVTRAARALEQARESDTVVEREAVRSSKPLPRAKAPKAQVSLEEAERRKAVAGQLVRESAAALLVVAGAHVEQAKQDCRERIESGLDETAAALEAARTALSRARETAGAASWLSALGERGQVMPFPRHGMTASICNATYGDITNALAHLGEEREARRQSIEQAQRELAAWEKELARRAAEDAAKAAARKPEEAQR